MEWFAFEVDGETFYWTAYPSESKTNDQPWIDNVYLHIARAPNTPGIGREYAAGTAVTEQDAVDTVLLFRAHNREMP